MARTSCEASQSWVPPRSYWNGETVFVLGGGASLIGFDFEQLRGHPIIAVNALGYDVLPIAKVTDFLFGQDAGFFEAHKQLVALWPGLILTTSPHAARRYPGRVQRIITRHAKEFLLGPYIRQGANSGQTAIALAIALGAVCVVLLGFDMKLINGRSHSHDFYAQPNDLIYRTEFIPKFRGWRADARKIGVDIVQGLPGSALTEFPCRPLADLLSAK